MIPEDSTGIVVRHILHELLHSMRSKETGICEDLDLEYLHDFRVALRRTRSLLNRLNGVLPLATVARFKREFDWLGKVTGPARDLDVCQLSLERLRAGLRTKSQIDLLSYTGFLQRQRQHQHTQVVKALASSRYRRIMNDWDKILARPMPSHTRLVHAYEPVASFASRHIWDAYRKVLKKGRRIHPDSAPRSLHELRKAFKNLRYLIEFFQDCYPAGDIRTLRRNMKAMQDTLGEFQDLQVQKLLLGEFLTLATRAGVIGTPILESCNTLQRRIEQVGNRTRRKSRTGFERFSAAPRRTLYRKLFRPRDGRPRHKMPAPTRDGP